MILQGDALHLPLAAASVDAMVTDPPSGTGFMGVDWDCFRRRHNPADVGRENVFGRTSEHAPHNYGESDRGRFIGTMRPILEECLRVLKPGAHAFVWALPRTSHWTATALEDAGFEIRDCVTHVFATGFPKSLDVSKAIDAAAGAEREVVGETGYEGPITKHDGFVSGEKVIGRRDILLTAPATPEAQQWDGWGTALKPASEHWWLCRKPLSEGTVAANVLHHGTGALNVDAGRIPLNGETIRTIQGGKAGGGYDVGSSDGTRHNEFVNDTGRWPANFLLSCACEVEHEEGCPVRMLDEQSGDRPGMKPGLLRRGATTGQGLGYHGAAPREAMAGYDDEGGASRFFFVAKPDRSEREAGLAALPLVTRNRVNAGGLEHDPKWAPVQAKNSHPTVKPVDLMRYLIRLICPPGGIVLDPFLGSGTTGVAARIEGMRFVGVERELEYIRIAQGRIDHALRPRPSASRRVAQSGQLPLFEETAP